jgi:hypothetical protein
MKNISTTKYSAATIESMTLVSKKTDTGFG